MNVGNSSVHITRWLLEAETRPRPLAGVVDALGAQLVEAGVPVGRIRTSITTKHPEIFVRSLAWEAGKAVEVSEARRNIAGTSAFLDSPIVKVRSTLRALRCRLTGPDADLSYPVCRELQAAGFTDYIIYPSYSRAVRSRTYRSRRRPMRASRTRRSRCCPGFYRPSRWGSSSTRPGS
jgi:hypothetical protein